MFPAAAFFLFGLALAQGDGLGTTSTGLTPSRTSVVTTHWPASILSMTDIKGPPVFSTWDSTATSIPNLSSQPGFKTQSVVLSAVLSVVGTIVLAVIVLLLLRVRARRRAALKRQRYAWRKNHSGWGLDIKTAPSHTSSNAEQSPPPYPFETANPPSPLTRIPTHTRRTSGI